MTTRVNLNALVKSLQEKLQENDVSLTLEKVELTVRELLDLIGDEISKGNTVALPNFGKFEKYTLASGKNKPKFTGAKALYEKL